MANRTAMSLILSPKQVQGRAMLDNPAKSRLLFDGGGRSGKTFLVTDWYFQRAFMYPGSWQIVLRKNRHHCKQALWNGTFQKYMNDYIDPRYYKLNKDELAINFRNGSRILFDGCDDDARVRNIYGNEYITMWFNEASEFKWTVVEQLASRLAQRVELDPRIDPAKVNMPPIAHGMQIFDTNPKGKRHWLYRAGVEHINPQTGETLPNADRWGRLGGWRPEDNKSHISEDAISTYQAMTGVTGRQMRDGEWCNVEGLVYDEFDEDVHVCQECTAMTCTGPCPRVWKKGGGGWSLLVKSIVRGVDFGFVDPFVCLVCGLDNDGRLLVFQCYHRTRRITTDHCQVIREKYPPEESHTRVKWTVADHNPEDAETMRREGVPTRKARKPKNKMVMVNAVKDRLKVQADGKPRIQVCKYCRPVLGELGSYLMDATKDGPEDGGDHCLDTLGYIVLELDHSTSQVVLLP